MSQSALITALLAKLANDSPFATAVGSRIYETLPHEPVFPLALIEIDSDEPMRTFGKAHIDAEFSVTIQGSLESGRRTLQATNALLFTALDAATLTPTGYNAGQTWCIDKGRSDSEDLDGGAVAIQDTYPRIVSRWRVFATQT